MKTSVLIHLKPASSPELKGPLQVCLGCDHRASGGGGRRDSKGVTPAAEGGRGLHLGPHLMLLSPWNCLFSACLSAHAESR